MCVELSALNSNCLVRDAQLLLELSSPKTFEAVRKSIEGEHSYVSGEDALPLAKTIEPSRMMNSVSLIILAMQELGKAYLAAQYFGSKKDLDFEDYQRILLNHDKKLETAIELLKELGLWREVLDQWAIELEQLRRATSYVDYDHNYGLWFGPTAVGSPEKNSLRYSAANLLYLLLYLEGQHQIARDESYELFAEDFLNTFVLFFGLADMISKAASVLLNAVKEVSDSKRSDIRYEPRFFKRFRIDAATSRKEKELLDRLRQFVSRAYPFSSDFLP